MALLWNEIKKTMYKKSTYLYMIITMVFSILLAWYCITRAGADQLNEDGSITIVKGRTAISLQKQAESVLSGQVTEDKLENVLMTYKSCYDKARNTLMYDQNLINSQKLYELINELNNKYMKFNEKTYKSPDEMPKKLAADYYEIRAEKIDRMIDASYSNRDQNEKAKKMNDSIVIPFSYYEGYSLWGKVFEYYCGLQIVVLVIAAFFTAPIFSENYQNGGDIIFRTTMYGRKSLAICRIACAEFYGIFLFVLSTVLFLGICALNIGIEGLHSSIQMMTIYAISNMTYGQALFCTVTGGIISMISTVSIITFFSVKMKEPVRTEIISAVFIVGWKAASMFFGNAATEFFFSSLPMSGTEIIYYLTSMNIYHIFNINVWEPYWTLCIAILTGMSFLFLTVVFYVRKKY